MKLQKNL